MLKQIAGALAVTGVMLATQIAGAGEYRLGLITPPPHQWTVTANTIAEELKEKTDGR